MKTTTKKFVKMTAAQNADFNFGKTEAWQESPRNPDGSEKYLAGFDFAGGIVSRLRTVEVVFPSLDCPEAEAEGREAGMLDDRQGSRYEMGTQEAKDWKRGFNSVFKARIQAKQLLDNAITKDARTERIVRWRAQEIEVTGAAMTRLPFGMTDQDEANIITKLALTQ